jgi:hypothetical protein
MSNKSISIREFKLKNNDFNLDGNTKTSIYIEHLVKTIGKNNEISTDIETSTLNNIESLSFMEVPIKSLFKEGENIETLPLILILNAIIFFISSEKKTLSPVPVNIRVTDAKTGLFLDSFRLKLVDKYTKEIYFDGVLSNHDNDNGFVTLNTVLGFACDAEISSDGYLSESVNVYFFNTGRLSFRLIPEGV